MTCVIISKAQVLTLNEMKRDQWVWVLVEDFRIREKKLIKYDYGLHFVHLAANYFEASSGFN